MWIFFHLAIAQLGNFGRSAQRNLIQPFQAMHDHGPRAAEIFKHVGDHADQLAAINADQLMGRHRRIGQRPEKIKDGANADIAARLHGVFHRFMEQRREQKANADFGDTLLDPFFGRIDFDPQSAQAHRRCPIGSIPNGCHAWRH